MCRAGRGPRGAACGGRKRDPARPSFRCRRSRGAGVGAPGGDHGGPAGARPGRDARWHRASTPLSGPSGREQSREHRPAAARPGVGGCAVTAAKELLVFSTGRGGRRQPAHPCRTGPRPHHGTHPRIQTGLNNPDDGLTQTLAAAPAVLHHWTGAKADEPYAWAALDAARLDVRTPSPPDYCTPPAGHRTTELVRTRLAYATTPLHGATTPLHGATATLSPRHHRHGPPRPATPPPATSSTTPPAPAAMNEAPPAAGPGSATTSPTPTTSNPSPPAPSTGGSTPSPSPSYLLALTLATSSPASRAGLLAQAGDDRLLRFGFDGQGRITDGPTWLGPDLARSGAR